MSKLCRFLEWDTAFFGINVASVEAEVLTPAHVQDIDHWCHQHEVRCLYFMARPDDAATSRLAEDNGFRLVDVRLTFERPTGPELIASDQTRLATAFDVPALKRIARDSYHDTRFYYDPNFPQELCHAFYETWIARSCDGYADAVLIKDLSGKVAGYLSCHLTRESRIGKIGLVGVSRHMQRQAVGQTLVHDALAWFGNHGAKSVTVVTQARNVAAQRLYQRCGFLITSVNLWYHKWFK